MDLDLVTTIGAGYGALQAIAQFVMLWAPKHTIAFRVAKYLVSGKSRPG
jgi:hypothetical protein